MSHTQQETTTNPVVEIKLCANSFEYFCKSYVKVKSPTKGLVALDLYDCQKEFCRFIMENDRTAMVNFRQGGFTTAAIALCVWKMLFEECQNILWVAKTDRECVYANEVFRQMVDLLPRWMKDVDTVNDHNVKFHNGNYMTFRTPINTIGVANNFLLVDQAAYISDANGLDLVNPCKVALFSTAKILQKNEKNWFYEIISNTLYDSFKSRAIIDWSNHPRYQDKNFVDQLKRSLGNINWRAEMECEFVNSKSEPWAIYDRIIDKPDLIASNYKKVKNLFDPQTKVGQTEVEQIDLNKTPYIKIEENDPPCSISMEHPVFPQEFTTSIKQVWENINTSMPDIIDVTSNKSDDREDYDSVDILAIAGICQRDGTPLVKSDYCQKMQKEICKGLPKQLTVGLEEETLTVNGIPTKINAKAIEMAVLGLSELVNEKQAIQTVGRIVRKKMKRLF
jgi:hypothetical protein